MEALSELRFEGHQRTNRSLIDCSNGPSSKKSNFLQVKGLFVSVIFLLSNLTYTLKKKFIFNATLSKDPVKSSFVLVLVLFEKTFGQISLRRLDAQLQRVKHAFELLFELFFRLCFFFLSFSFFLIFFLSYCPKFRRFVDEP
jgi:hypothetical protein